MGDEDYNLEFIGIVYVPKMEDMPSFHLYSWNKID